ncbi:MAG TPA: aminodeoxychorismate lyase [Gammaproteobacteria bacterium]|jgi:4-amino-4-deoxychorismate lyase|nr:aminodeoxychorismate lyase [Gammaproteobacteria bacterium]
MKSAAWIDGQPADALPLTDRGLHYGDGLFETLAVRGGRVQRLALHLDRLQESCGRLGFVAPDRGSLEHELQQAAQGQERVVLKLILTRGSGGRGYRPPAEPAATRILFRYPWPDYPATWSEQGIELRLCTTRLACNPALAGLKHLNRLEQVLARAELSEGAPEGLMLDTGGRAVEGTMTNLFASPAEDRLVTPDLSQAGIAGVTRRHILARAEQAGIKTEVRHMGLDELLDQREIFVCNSIAGVWPVTRIGARSYPIGSLTRLAKAWAAET